MACQLVLDDFMLRGLRIVFIVRSYLQFCVVIFKVFFPHGYVISSIPNTNNLHSYIVLSIPV